MNFFEPVRMKSMYNDASLQSGVYVSPANENLPTPNGTTAVISYNLAHDEIYDTPDINTWRMNPTTGSANIGLFIYDFSEVPEYEIGDNGWRIGIDITDITAPAGAALRWRELHKNDYFWLGDGAFTATPSVNGSASLAANGRWAPGSPATGNPAIKIVDTKTVFAGLENRGTAYLCVVTSL